MSFYLSNLDVWPTGVEPAEFIEPPSPGDGDAQFAERRLPTAFTSSEPIALDGREVRPAETATDSDEVGNRHAAD